MEFCIIDNIGEVTSCAKNKSNRLAGAAPQMCEIKLYFNFYIVSFCRPDGIADLHVLMAQTMPVAGRQCLLEVALIQITFPGQNSPKNSMFYVNSNGNTWLVTRHTSTWNQSNYNHVQARQR
jgi:hypothetical protein